MTKRSGRATTTIVAALGASVLASLSLTVVYALGGQPQVEGALLGVALGTVAFALVLLARHMLPKGNFSEARKVVPDVDQRPQAAAGFDAGAEPIERRALLAKAFVAALAALGVASLFPIRSLGSRPGRTL
ncbi:MAG TPA: hypothetical protein VHE80_11685, partial [Acidimicrobiales bacterium]|nr:hypothetical protein [Acidimicrobiales bacterium]